MSVVTCSRLTALVKPVLAGPRHQHISLLHRDGSELVKVETIDLPISHDSILGATGLPQAQISSSPELIASALGFSPNFSLDEAFHDALGKLRLSPVSSSGVKEPSIVDVVSMGAVYGGFSGYSRLFVRVEQSKLLDVTAESFRGTATRRNEKLRG